MHVKNGQCLIINQRNYSSNTEENNHFEREGTEQDEKCLVEQWEKLSCHCHIARDLTKIDMISTLKKFRDTILVENQPDFMVLVILGHGRLNPKTKREEILSVNYEGISTDGILEMFLNSQKCPTMATKPKLFYIQACRGNEFQKSISEIANDCFHSNDLTPKTHVNDGRSSYLPDWSKSGKQVSWYHIVYSTIKGYLSFRDQERGSLFIQTLCEVLKEDGSSYDVNTISSSVISKVMSAYDNIQAPVSINQLGDKVYFKPESVPSNTSEKSKIKEQAKDVLKYVFLLFFNHPIQSFFIAVFLLIFGLSYFQNRVVISIIMCTFKCTVYRMGNIAVKRNPFGIVEECVAIYQNNCCNCNNFFFE